MEKMSGDDCNNFKQLKFSQGMFLLEQKSSKLKASRGFKRGLTYSDV